MHSSTSQLGYQHRLFYVFDKVKHVYSSYISRVSCCCCCCVLLVNRLFRWLKLGGKLLITDHCQPQGCKTYQQHPAAAATAVDDYARISLTLHLTISSHSDCAAATAAAAAGAAAGCSAGSSQVESCSSQTTASRQPQGSAPAQVLQRTFRSTATAC
jgi:hypothetical protein